MSLILSKRIRTSAQRFVNVTHTTLELKNIIQLRATMIREIVIKTICRSKQCGYRDIAMMLYTNII